MDGTETGWGRPAEPAPRWRALLDRALLGGRTGEQAEVSDRRAEERRTSRGIDERSRPGNGAGGYGSTAYPSERGYPEPPSVYGREPGEVLGAESDRRQAEPDYSQESRYALLDNGYQPPAYPQESRYAALDPNYAPPPPAYPQESRYAALDPNYAPPVSHAAPAPPFEPTIGRVTPVPAAPVVPTRVPPPPPPDPTPPSIPAGPSRTPTPIPSRVGRGQSTPARVAPADDGYPSPLLWRANRAESETDRAISVLRRSLGPPRVLAFANPKGGVHKTTATVLAAATIGSVRGRGVLAWDDNELRGTLGLRAGSARHARTIRHLVSDLVRIEAGSDAELLDRLDDYLRHASDGSYDVLAGEESPRFAQRLDKHTVTRVLDVLRRTHDVICVDTGNNVESVNWQTVLRAADQLVVTTVPREDAAFTADWMLDLLHEEGMGHLVENAVTLLSCPTPGRSPLLDDLERHFATRTRAVAVVPYDPALESGASIEYGYLQPETRDAWLRAASVMVEPFAR